MSHMSPFRLNVQNIPSELSTTSSNPKKRRKNAQTPIQTSPNVQDLLPPPLSGYGDTIVASNPFDDCPSTVNSMNMRNSAPMSIGPGMGMPGSNMGMCRSMGNPEMGKSMFTCNNMSGSPMMHSPNSHANPHMMGSPMMMNGPRLNGPMTAHMPHMMHSPSGPMHRIAVPMHSPMGMMGPMAGGGMGPQPPLNGGPPMNGPGSGPPMGHANGPPMGGQPHNNNMMMSTMNSMYSKPMPVSAGKIYPADQPMVFNSQNPNAPPIYPCGVCHKEVHDNDQAILCESGCNFWFHRGCTGLTEHAFQLLTAEVYAEWVCDKCLLSKNIPLVKFKP